MSVAFAADQGTNYRVPHTFTCALLGISVSWFYKWLARGGDPDGVHTDTDRRRAQLDDAVRTAFTAAKGLHGSPRLVADLRELGWTVSARTVAESMRRQGLIARKIGVQQARCPAVDGAGGVVFRQRRRRGVLLFAGVGSAVP